MASDDPVNVLRSTTARIDALEREIAALAVARRAAVVALKDSGLSYEKIGVLVGLSRGRIEQIHKGR